MGNTLCTMDIPQEFIRDNTEVETLEDIPQNMPMDKESSILPIEPKALTNLFWTVGIPKVGFKFGHFSSWKWKGLEHLHVYKNW